MTWHHPAALAGMALLAVPIVVHLLIRHHAARVVFPAMRFVPSVRAAAVRLRTPSDRALLLLRLAIVAAAVLAAAQPLVTTAARERAWRSRVARAIVVDTSPSVPADVAARLADQAAAGVFVSHRFTSPDLRDGIRRATEWLESTSAAERDIVIVGDFQRGSLDQGDLIGVPATTGIVVMRAGRPAAAAARGTIDGWRNARWSASLSLTETSTQATWTRQGALPSAGLTVRSRSSDRAAAERAAEAAKSAGVTAEDAARPIEVAFAGADAVADVPPATPWIVSAAMALRTSPLLAETGAEIQIGERAGALIVNTPLPATSSVAPAIIRAVWLAARPSVIEPESEPGSIDNDTVRRMGRTRTALASGRPTADDSDGRWLWATALALLGAETAVRSRGARRRVREAHADAA